LRPGRTRASQSFRTHEYHHPGTDPDPARVQRGSGQLKLDIGRAFPDREAFPVVNKILILMRLSFGEDGHGEANHTAAFSTPCSDNLG